MKEHPIIFTAEMVRAILAGRKSVTRRIIQCRHGYEVSADKCTDEEVRDRKTAPISIPKGEEAAAVEWLTDHCPYGKPGDKLWVRENCYLPLQWESNGEAGDGEYVVSRYADAKPSYLADGGEQPVRTMRTNSIHMPRWASRITLEVVSVRVERLHEITEAEAKLEGLGGPYTLMIDARTRFAELWDQINGKRAPWESNPFVWRIEFNVLKPTEKK